MAEEVEGLIGIDSSVLIEYFRKTNKENSFLFKLIHKDFQGFVASIIVHYEIYKGATNQQINYWNNIFADIFIISYTPKINAESLAIYKQLQKVRKSIEIKDLMIAATSKSSNYSLATINEKHYIHIEGLKLITPGRI